jgi:hypothetical protein
MNSTISNLMKPECCCLEKGMNRDRPSSKKPLKFAKGKVSSKSAEDIEAENKKKKFKDNKIFQIKKDRKVKMKKKKKTGYESILKKHLKPHIL